MLFHCAAALSRLSLKALYRCADWLLYPVMYHVIRYRRRMVAKNLRMAFPEKTEAERQEIAIAFYHQFCDTIVESLYGWHQSNEQLRPHMIFENMEEANRLIDAAGGGLFTLAHMGDWEWMATMQNWVSPGVKEINVYRRLKNAQTDRIMLALRAQRGGACVEKQRILREMIRYRNEKQPVIVGLLSDQKPRPEVTRVWLPFLHQETGFLDGAEVLARKFGYPVFYVFLTRTARGYYKGEVRILAADPKTTSEGEITAAYVKALEENIRTQPELWLWTHNRFKWTKPA